MGSAAHASPMIGFSFGKILKPFKNERGPYFFRNSMTPLPLSSIKSIAAIYSPADEKFIGSDSTTHETSLVLLRIRDHPEAGGRFIENAEEAWAITEDDMKEFILSLPQSRMLMVRVLLN